MHLEDGLLFSIYLDAPLSVSRFGSCFTEKTCFDTKKIKNGFHFLSIFPISFNYHGFYDAKVNMDEIF